MIYPFPDFGLPEKIKDQCMEYTSKYRQMFFVLLDEVRNLLGYSIRKDDFELGEELAMEMMYGGFDFSVVHSTIYRPELLLIECRFGPVPEGREFPIMKKILQMNCALAEIDGSIFCIEADSGDLVYTLAQRMTDLDGKSFLYKMTEIVWHGRRWLETRFVSEEGTRTDKSLSPIALA